MGRKSFSIIIAVIVLFLIPNFCFGARDVSVIVNDVQLVFEDQAPVISGNRTYIPIRAIADALKAETIWDKENQTVTIVRDGKQIVLKIGSKDIKIINQNGEVEYKTMDAAPILVNGRTLLPIKFIAEIFGDKVEWDKQHFIVYITDYFLIELESAGTPNNKSDSNSNTNSNSNGNANSNTNNNNNSNVNTNTISNTNSNNNANTNNNTNSNSNANTNSNSNTNTNSNTNRNSNANRSRNQNSDTDMRGMELKDAQNLLEEQGYKVVVLRQYNDDFDSGVVFAQEDITGGQLEIVHTVVIYVSLGSGGSKIVSADKVPFTITLTGDSNTNVSIYYTKSDNAKEHVFVKNYTGPTTQKIVPGDYTFFIKRDGAVIGSIPNIQVSQSLQSMEMYVPREYMKLIIKTSSKYIKSGIMVELAPAGTEDYTVICEKYQKPLIINAQDAPPDEYDIRITSGDSIATFYKYQFDYHGTIEVPFPI